MRTIQDNWSDFGDEPSRGLFQKHLAEMRAFRNNHEANGRGDSPMVRATGKKQATAAQNSVETLLEIGWVLNLIREKEALLLPKNWQN